MKNILRITRFCLSASYAGRQVVISKVNINGTATLLDFDDTFFCGCSPDTYCCY